MFSNDEETTLEPRIASKKSWKKEEKGLKKKKPKQTTKTKQPFLKKLCDVKMQELCKNMEESQRSD